jgi:hypothetical protein
MSEQPPAFGLRLPAFGSRFGGLYCSPTNDLYQGIALAVPPVAQSYPALAAEVCRRGQHTSELLQRLKSPLTVLSRGTPVGIP